MPWGIVLQPLACTKELGACLRCTCSDLQRSVIPNQWIEYQVGLNAPSAEKLGNQAPLESQDGRWGSPWAS